MQLWMTTSAWARHAAGTAAKAEQDGWDGLGIGKIAVIGPTVGADPEARAAAMNLFVTEIIPALRSESQSR